MNFIQLASRTKKIVSDNSPVILTALGVTGTITTAYLAAKASFKASEIIRHQGLIASNKETFKRETGDSSPSEPFDTKKKAKLVWKLYIPTAGTAVMTCTCIIAANYIGTRRAAALAAAYSITERAFSEYKTKVVERLGEESEKDLRREIAQDRIDRTAPDREVVFVANGGTLCHDAFSGRYFLSDKETLRRAANDINYQILHSDYATITDFYEYIGLESTTASDEMGWNTENPLELLFSTTETPDGRPCISFDFAVVPIRDPWRFR